MARRTLFRAAVAVAMATVLTMTGAVALAPSAAAAPAVGPAVPVAATLGTAAAPSPPSAECEWYGTMSLTRRSYSYNTEYDWSDRQYESRVWTSEPVPGRECGATWTAQFTSDYVDNDPASVDGQDCTRTFTNTGRADAAGTGYTDIKIATGTEEFPFYLYAFAYADQEYDATNTLTLTGCGENNEPSVTTNSTTANIAAGCSGQPGNVIPVESADVQAISYTCTTPFEDTNDSGTVTTSVEEFKVDVRRNVCDSAIDSDADGLSDCFELDESGTDPNNPDTDGDGFEDDVDQCGLEAGTLNGCPNLDQDGDGVPDTQDNCVSVLNGDQSNVDGDAAGDACDEDIDGDGLSNTTETTAGTSPTSTDSDGDGLSDSVETNGGQRVDTDQDGTVDGADTDTDGDGTPDSEEGTGDSDGDGIPNWRDPVTSVHGVIKLDMAIDYDVYWYDNVPNFSFTKKPGSDRVIVEGATSVNLRGAPAVLGQVREVCVDVLWRATVTRNATTYPVHWEENNVDLDGAGDTRWENPPTPTLGGLASELRLDQPYCVQGTALVWSTSDIEAETNNVGIVTNFVALQQIATVTVRLRDGRTFTDQITETEKAAKKPPRAEDFDSKRNGRPIRI